MAGKASIPSSVHSEIRRLAEIGMSRKAIMSLLNVSTYTYRRATDPDFAERERERQRNLWPWRKEERAGNSAYQAYQDSYGAKPEHLARVRAAMAALRKARRNVSDEAN
jgi:hypothetical protein